MLGSGFVEFKDIPSHESSIFAIFYFPTLFTRETYSASDHSFMCESLCVCVYEE